MALGQHPADTLPWASLGRFYEALRPGSMSLGQISCWGCSAAFKVSVLVLPVVLGNIQAVALRDIFVQAQNRDSSPPSLQIEEPEWEKRRSVNLSELIDIYR